MLDPSDEETEPRPSFCCGDFSTDPLKVKFYWEVYSIYKES